MIQILCTAGYYYSTVTKSCVSCPPGTFGSASHCLAVPIGMCSLYFEIISTYNCDIMSNQDPLHLTVEAANICHANTLYIMAQQDAQIRMAVLLGTTLTDFPAP